MSIFQFDNLNSNSEECETPITVQFKFGSVFECICLTCISKGPPSLAQKTPDWQNNATSFQFSCKGCLPWPRDIQPWDHKGTSAKGASIGRRNESKSANQTATHLFEVHTVHIPSLIIFAYVDLGNKCPGDELNSSCHIFWSPLKTNLVPPAFTGIVSVPIVVACGGALQRINPTHN